MHHATREQVSLESVKMIFNISPPVQSSDCRLPITMGSRSKSLFSEWYIFGPETLEGLRTVATVPDHQSNKTCWHWDSFWYQKLLQYVGIENYVQKHIVKQCVFCIFPPPMKKKDSSSCPSIGFPYGAYTVLQQLPKLANGAIIHGYQTCPLVEFFSPRTGAWTDLIFCLHNPGWKPEFQICWLSKITPPILHCLCLLDLCACNELVSECQLPECQLPECQLPECQLPKYQLPKCQLSEYQLPNFYSLQLIMPAFYVGNCCCVSHHRSNSSKVVAIAVYVESK